MALWLPYKQRATSLRQNLQEGSRHSMLQYRHFIRFIKLQARVSFGILSSKALIVPPLHASTRSFSLVSYTRCAKFPRTPTFTAGVFLSVARKSIQLSKPQRVIRVELPSTYVQRWSKVIIFVKQLFCFEGDTDMDSNRSKT